MSKGSRLGDRPEHGDGTRIIRSSVRARAAASPIAEAIIGGWRCADRESRATSMPTVPGTYMAACPSAHSEVILGAEFRRVGRLHRGRDAMRDGSGVTPATKVVANIRATALRRSGRYGMSRTRRPRKCLGGAVIGAIDAEGATAGSCLDSYQNRWKRIPH